MQFVVIMAKVSKQIRMSLVKIPEYKNERVFTIAMVITSNFQSVELDSIHSSSQIKHLKNGIHTFNNYRV